MVLFLSDGQRVSRKPYQCFDCYREIPKGTLHYFSTCKNDGDVYTLRHHLDCRAAHDHYSADWPWLYMEDGVPPLADSINDSGQAEHELNALRGHFPHVVTRIELGHQLAAARALLADTEGR